MSVLSLASSLNMRYLHDLDDITGLERARESRVVLNDHEVGRLLTGAGYEYVHLGSWADFSQTAASADRVLTDQSAFAINAEFVRLSIVMPLQSLFRGEFGGRQAVGTYYLQKIHGLNQVQALTELAQEEPDHAQFVFAHLILPHEPYVFDVDGSILPPSATEELGVEAAYGRQLEFTNRFLLDLVTRLQRREDPPIIIIQADEGPLPEGFFDIEDVPFETMSEADDRMHNAIFSAVFIPDGMLPLSEGEPVTSVNIIRAAMAHALGQPFERLEDHSYSFANEWMGPYREITDLAFSTP